MDAIHQSNLLSSVKLMKELKDLIICEAQALFSPQHSTGREYDIIISKTHGGTSDEYEARLILYTAQSPANVHSEWMVLLVNPCLCESPVDAMVDLLEGLYERAGTVQVGLKEGETFRGAR